MVIFFFISYRSKNLLPLTMYLCNSISFRSKYNNTN